MTILVLYQSVPPTFYNKIAPMPGTTFTSWSKRTTLLWLERPSNRLSAQNFTLWQQATIEITYSHSISACLRHIYSLRVFFTHIPYVVNRILNKMLTKRLQHLQQGWARPVFLKVSGIAPLGAILMAKGGEKGAIVGRNNTKGAKMLNQ